MKLTAKQREVLEMMAGGTKIEWEWGWVLFKRLIPTMTVNALLRRKYLVLVGDFTAEITDAGRKALEEGGTR